MQIITLHIYNNIYIYIYIQLKYLTSVYGLAWNTQLIMLSGTPSYVLCQVWPGEKASECRCTIAMYETQERLPKTEQDLAIQRKVAAFVLDVLAIEDFVLLPSMHQNFESCRHAMAIFGRHEPKLTYTHRMFDSLINHDHTIKLTTTSRL